MTFNSHKRSDAKSDVIQHRAKSSALRAFDQTLLFQSAMIHLNAPRRFGLGFALGFGHRLQIRRPVFRRAVCGANAKHFDFSKAFEPADCPIAAAQPGIGYGFQSAFLNIDLPSRFGMPGATRS